MSIWFPVLSYTHTQTHKYISAMIGFNGFTQVSTNLFLEFADLSEPVVNNNIRSDGFFQYAEYSEFSLAPETDFYRLYISGYSGTEG